MTLVLGPQALVNAGGGLAYVLVGVLAAASRGGGRARVALAAGAVAFGAAFVLANVWVPDALAPLLGFGVPAWVAGVLFALFVVEAAKPLGRGASRAFAAAAFGLIGVGSALAARADLTRLGEGFLSTPGLADATGRAFAAFIVTSLTLMLAVGLAGVRFHRTAPPDRAERGAWVGFAAFAASYAMFQPYRLLGFGAVLADAPAPRALLALSAAVGVAAALAWLPRAGSPDPRLGRRVALALLAFALAAVVVGVASARAGLPAARDFGLLGAARTVGALALALAVLKHRFLGIEPPAFSVARGPVAAGALATLFVVAQVAQNFFEAQYGILLGGVVAGAFVFAAQPIQRAIEGRHVARTIHANAAPQPSPHHALETYRHALTIAYADGDLSPAEEERLAHLADHLGIRASEALALRREVEREATAR